MNDWIWITWERNRRTRELCRDLGIPLFEREFRLSRVLRYPLLALWTVGILIRQRPKGVLIQNPSIVLASWAVLLRAIFRYALVVDTHNTGLELRGDASVLLCTMRRFVVMAADLTIITNSFLAQHVRENGGRAFILPDRLPDFQSICPNPTLGNRSVVCIL